MKGLPSRLGLVAMPASLLVAALLCASPAAGQNQRTILAGPGWQVMRADWDAGNRSMDVTYRVRMMLSGNGTVRVTKRNLGGDPAVGGDKVLTVIYRYQGREQTATVKQANMLSIP
jgi:hypothetical protein